MGKPLQRGDKVSKNWISINQNSGDIQALQMEVARLRAALADMRRAISDTPTLRYPFRVYFKPNTERAVTDADAWRKFYVQHGYVNLVKTTGADDTDGEGTVATEIAVPDATAVYYVWVEVTFTAGTVTLAEVKHGAAGWTGYPNQSGLPTKYYALLAKINTQTFSAEKRAVVRQFRQGDIFIEAVGSGAPTWI